MSLYQLGWNDDLQLEFNKLAENGALPARVAREDRESYLLLSNGGALRASVSGAFRYRAITRADFPAVGDWVVAHARPEESAATIHALIPRQSVISRLAAGTRAQEQILAANVDVLLICCGLDRDFNLRRIERYLTVARAGGVKPLVALTKADACADVPARISECRAVAGDAQVLAVSSVDDRGLPEIRARLTAGVTAALVGSSGVGKSSLVNVLLGEERLATGAVRLGDGRGRHTTTYRQMLTLADGGVLIDTPGMRELQVLADEEHLEASFGDIESLTARCRFADCAHESEPGCAVRAAIDSGALDPQRLASFRKLQRELRHMETRDDLAAQAADKARWKSIHKAAQKWHRQKYRM